MIDDNNFGRRSGPVSSKSSFLRNVGAGSRKGSGPNVVPRAKSLRIDDQSYSKTDHQGYKTRKSNPDDILFGAESSERSAQSSIRKLQEISWLRQNLSALQNTKKLRDSQSAPHAPGAHDGYYTHGAENIISSSIVVSSARAERSGEKGSRARSRSPSARSVPPVSTSSPVVLTSPKYLSRHNSPTTWKVHDGAAYTNDYAYAHAASASSATGNQNISSSSTASVNVHVNQPAPVPFDQVRYDPPNQYFNDADLLRQTELQIQARLRELEVEGDLIDRLVHRDLSTETMLGEFVSLSSGGSSQGEDVTGDSDDSKSAPGRVLIPPTP